MAKLFKLPQHKRFNYTPRFYNERDEQRKHRFARIDRDMERAARTDGDAERENHYIKFARKTKKKSNITLLLVLGLLLLLYYFFMMR